MIRISLTYLLEAVISSQWACVTSGLLIKKEKKTIIKTFQDGCINLLVETMVLFKTILQILTNSHSLGRSKKRPLENDSRWNHCNLIPWGIQSLFYGTCPGNSEFQKSQSGTNLLNQITGKEWITNFHKKC